MATNVTISQDMLKAVEVHGLPASVAGVRPGPDDMLTMTELAARLKQAMRTVERWHRNGVVLGIKVDGVVMFYWPSVVARLVERYQEKEPRAKAEAPPPPACAKTAAPPPVKLPIPKVPPSALRTPSPVPTGAGRSAVATAKRPQ